MCNVREITEEMIISLRESLKAQNERGEMSDKRYNHTLEVERMAARIGAIYAPDKINTLRAAALLHDITKEYSTELQLKICAEREIQLTEQDVLAAKTLHARTAAALIPERYPELATPEVISAVRWHTTGKEGMSICERIIYLADYIDMSRKFGDCVALRNYFFGVDLDAMTEEERLVHLDETLLISYDMTMRGLIEKSAPISPETIAARNELAVLHVKRRA